MSENKSERRDNLFMSQKNGHELIEKEERELCEKYCAQYKSFLNTARTERETVRYAEAMAAENGFVPYTRGMELKTGDRVYKNIHKKALMMAVIGARPLSEGAAITAAHVDAPRLDLKQAPMFEDSELAYFKTHYYGGIKKYQWTAIPLELRGVVALSDGRVIDIVIGNDRDDPQFVITDLLPHLGADQMKKTLSECICGEGLNILIGSIPDAEEGSDRVKLAVLSILNEKYGITEEDFLTAELSAVPAFEARDLGIDRSMIGGYGHDDRACTFAALRAIVETELPEKTSVCLLVDKEEIGSEGISGMQSEAFECFMEDLCEAQGTRLRHCFENSVCISADVCNAFDPNYPEVSEKRNNARLNYGMSLMKYTGSRGKSGSNDADAEFISYLRSIFKKSGVSWQTGELGKVDQGGGGTVAKYMANRNIETIDAGVPVLSMHSPFEAVSKFDCYMTYKGLKAFYNAK